jgi:hypothetical protein
MKFRKIMTYNYLNKLNQELGFHATLKENQMLSFIKSASQYRK